MNQLNFWKLLKKALLSLSFAQLSFGPSIIYAQMSAEQVVNLTQQIGGATIDLYGQYQQQQIMAAQMIQGARGVQPPLKPNDLVKQCNMPQKPDPMPAKCLDPVAEVAPQEAGAAMASACNAEKALNYLKGALPGGESSSVVSCPNPVTGFNSNVPTGLLPTSTYGANCMEDFRENLALQIQNGVLNDLKRIKSSLAEEVKLAKEANKQILNDIKDVNDELNGSDNPDGGGIKEFFAQDAACQLAMDSGAMPSLNSVGLNGAVKMFETPVGKNKRPLTALAQDFRNNAEAIRGDLKNIITKMSETASSLGPDGFMKDLEKGGPAFGLYVKEFDSIKKLIPQTVGSYKKERDRVAQKFADMGMQMPNLDEDFDKNSEALLSNTSFFENCFIGRESGASIPLDQIQFKTAKGFTGGTIENKVKKSMQEILNNPDLDSQAKLSRIRDLDQEIYRDPKTGRPVLEIRVDVNGTPTNFGLAQFYNNQATNCEKKFKTSSDARNLEEASKLVDSLKGIKSSFQTNLRSIVGQIENCNGASLRNNPNACSDGSAMSPSSPAFCLDTAARCEQSIQSCFQKAQGLRNQKVAQRRDLANIFNGNMIGLKQRFDAQIEDLNKSVSGVQKSLGGFLKVAEVIPEMDRMSTLSMEESPFGVDLLDAGSFDRFEKNVPQAIDALMQAMQKQGETINQKIVDNMKEESDRVGKLISEFEEIKKSCENVFQTKQQQDAEKQKEQQELLKKAADACSNARNSFAPQTKPGCEQLKKVADDMYEVASVLTPNAMGFANGISSYCDQEQKADDPAGESAVGELSRICNSGGDPKSELKRLKDKVLGDQKYADLIKEDPSFEGSPAGRTAKEIETALSIIEKKETAGTVSASKKDKAKQKLKDTHQAVVDAIKECDKALERELKGTSPFDETGYPHTGKQSLGYKDKRILFNQKLKMIEECKTKDVDSGSLAPTVDNYEFKTIGDLMDKWQEYDHKKGSPCYKPNSANKDRGNQKKCRESVRDYLIAENTKCSQDSLMKVSDIGQSNHTQKADDFDDKIVHCKGDDKKKAQAAIKEFKAAANNPDTFKKTPGDSGICQQMISDANAYGDEICTEDVVTDKEPTTTPSTGSSSGSSDGSSGGSSDDSTGDQTSSSETRTTPQSPKNVTPAKIKGCDPKEKAAERMNNPVDVDLKIIDNAIKMGQTTQGLSGSNPYLNKIGEHLNGACHMGEIPNPSDILNPMGTQSADEERIYGSDIRNQ